MKKMGILIPDLRLPEEKEQMIGIWGRRHLDYLKQHRKVTYTNLLTSGRLRNVSIRLIEDMKQTQGITERLKEDDALEWTGRLGNIGLCKGDCE